jgi:hypothetical protein
MTRWAFADLEPPHVDLVREAERTLGADYVVAFQRRTDTDAEPPTPPPQLAPAPLDESRLDCLRGLEDKLNVVLVAYRAS